MLGHISVDHTVLTTAQDSRGGTVIKNSLANAGDADVGSIPGSGRSLGGGHGNPPQYSCLENPMEGGALQAVVHSVRKSWA